MFSCITWSQIQNVANVAALCTPVIVFIWFLYSQNQFLSARYFKELNGIYAGYTEPISQVPDLRFIQSGIIMNIRETDEKGFFKGEFDFAETDDSRGISFSFKDKQLRDGIHTFMGEMSFKWYKSRRRHPLKPNENRIYPGTLYIIDRLDFDFSEFKIETYLQAEYSIQHYREMGTLVFKQTKIHRAGYGNLPKEFTLYKKMGSSFEPYKNVKETVFMGDTRADK